MNITDLIKRKRFAPGPGVSEPPPDKGIKRFFFLLWTHLWKLATLNLLFLAFCIPVVTIPAAFCGMNRVIIKLVREGNCFLWSDFITEFKANLFKSLPFGLLHAFLLFDSYYALSVGVVDGKVTNLLMTAVGFLLLGASLLYSSYVFVLLPSLPLKNRHIAKNAFILMMTEWKTNLLILGCTIMMVLITMMFFPYTLFLLAVIWFSFMQLIVCTAINEPMQRRIIEPYEQRQVEGL